MASASSPLLLASIFMASCLSKYFLFLPSVVCFYVSVLVFCFLVLLAFSVFLGVLLLAACVLFVVARVFAFVDVLPLQSVITANSIALLQRLLKPIQNYFE